MLAPFFITPSWRRGCRSHEIQRPAESRKMRETTEKLLRYVSEENITPEMIFAEETVQWTVICAIIYDVLPSFLEELKKL